MDIPKIFGVWEYRTVTTRYPKTHPAFLNESVVHKHTTVVQQLSVSMGRAPNFPVLKPSFLVLIVPFYYVKVYLLVPLQKSRLIFNDILYPRAFISDRLLFFFPAQCFNVKIHMYHLSQIFCANSYYISNRNI